ncbi:hypothetical protein LMG7974_01931 [Campylobacter majalis]|uniref:Uncharacterized protein n=1 Tax=Campylobacter majalis TaxID=2790656 RepID=A0ABM8QA29_9BACT|nr:hypothetical protein LMG7974_01931 [Campylobacter majalis]
MFILVALRFKLLAAMMFELLVFVISFALKLISSLLIILALSLFMIDLFECILVCLSETMVFEFIISPLAFMLIWFAFIIPALFTPTPSLVAMIFILLAYIPPRAVLSIEMVGLLGVETGLVALFVFGSLDAKTLNNPD